TSQPFYLAYQGYNDRDLQRLYGSLVCRVISEQYPAVTLGHSLAGSGRIRVGFVSGFFHAHTVWKLFIKGWMTQLDRTRFETIGYSTGVAEDAETRTAAGSCDRFIRGPASIDEWRKMILADAPHVLIYPEIGMDPVTPQLA